MIYVREEITALWKATGYVNPLTDSNISLLSSADYRRSSNILICPKCGKTRQQTLTRVHGVWACHDCNKTRIKDTKRHYRAANICLITNDLFSYFGDKISSDSMFDPIVVEGFINFAGYRERPAVCLLFMSLLHVILTKETQALKIIPYLQRMDKELSKSSEQKLEVKTRSTIVGT